MSGDSVVLSRYTTSITRNDHEHLPSQMSITMVNGRKAPGFFMKHVPTMNQHTAFRSALGMGAIN